MTPAQEAFALMCIVAALVPLTIWWLHSELERK